MRKIHNELQELELLYKEYEGVDRFSINKSNHMGRGTVVVLDGTTIPSSFNRLMSSPKTSIEWIQPATTVNIKLSIQNDAEFQANVSD